MQPVSGLLVIVAALLVAPSLQDDPEAHMTAPEIIAYWGYPVEIHTVTTEDGYILTLHRIPYGKNQSSAPTTPRPVAFLQHGLLASSSNWVTNLPHLALGYMMADQGYDVWMGNMRGNVYSRNHVSLSPNSNAYWQFSWQEMAQYDLPAMVDYVLGKTGQQSLYYVGHSQGTLTMFIALSTNAVQTSKIRTFYALAPIGVTKHIQGLLQILAYDFSLELDALWLAGGNNFLPDPKWVQLAESLFCKGNVGDGLCNWFLLLIGGTASHQLNETRIPVFLCDEPGGTSVKNIVHWTQLTKKGAQEKFDYGNAVENLLHYHQFNPPSYNISNITNADIHLYWSEADWLADGKDIQDFLLPKLAAVTVKSNNELTDFNHLDFIWGNRAAAEIYTPIIEQISSDWTTYSHA